MKKKLFLIIFIFFTIVLITGCDSKKNDRVDIMKNLIGTWEYEVNVNNDYVKGLKSTFSFDDNYNFTYVNVTILENGQEMVLKNLDGTYKLNLDAKKIILDFYDKKESEDLINELSYKYENGKFALNPEDNGNETYLKK